MAVHKRTYRGYNGIATPRWSRFLVVTRSASRNLFRSRFMTGAFIVCLFPFLITAALIYLNHSTSLLGLLKFRGGQLFEIDGKFFHNVITAEFGLAYLLTAFIGPGLVSPDLANNGLLLYLCRPLSRAEYVLGKFVVIARLLSLVTWIPGLLLFLIQGSLSGWTWTWNHLYIAWAIFAGSWLMIILLSLLGLALSAWVKWKPVAGALVLGVMFLGAGFGAAINATLRTGVGNLINIPILMSAIWASLFRIEFDHDVSFTQAVCALMLMAAACLWLLSRRIRGHEVVK